MKAAEAYSIRKYDKVYDKVNTSLVEEFIVQHTPQPPKREVVSNILMVWTVEDKVNHYSLNQDEFEKLQKLAKTLPPDEFESLVQEGMDTSKTYLMARVDNILDGTPMVAIIQ